MKNTDKYKTILLDQRLLTEKAKEQILKSKLIICKTKIKQIQKQLINLIITQDDTFE